MGRYIGSVCRLCRREGNKLFLKGSRCFTEKCAIERRSYSPGQHGQARPRISEYQIQLREKQKLKRIYGLLERQFSGYFKKAAQKKGITGENLLQLLERRIDNVVYRMGFCSSRKESRQMVNHGHFRVNGRKVDIASFLVKDGDVIELKQASRQLPQVQASLTSAEGRGIPQWLELDKGNFKGRVKTMPTKDDLNIPVNEQLVVELYSR
ncbi:MAG TPA: 30S ribosomal protein S4 [Nitrospiria bacterium]|nr:30S ribosomal protein S4 [Nitrospiria bacterium]HUK57533.1 30S ribosomal protein S4 [Nitrospiria bacterium]